MTKCKGTWVIKSKVPSTPEVRYRTSPANPWTSVIGGTWYTVDPIYGTNPNRSYILKIRQRWVYGARSGQTTIENRWQREVVFHSVPIAGEIISVFDDMTFGSSPFQQFSSWLWLGVGKARVRRKNAQGQISDADAIGVNAFSLSAYTSSSNSHTNDIDPVGTPKDATTFGTVSGSYANAQARANTGANISVQTIAGSTKLEAILPAVANQPPDGYRLQVRDCNNNILADVTLAAQPEVDTIPSMMPDEWGKDEITAASRLARGYPLEGFYLVLDKATQNQVKVRLRHESDNAFEYLAKLFERHPCASGHTQVKITCSDEEECPDGTCEVACSGHRCCYSSDGISVKILPPK